MSGRFGRAAATCEKEGGEMKQNKPSMSTKYGHSMYKKFLPLAILLAFIFASATCPPKPQPEKVWVNVCNSFPDLPASEARIANEYCPSHPAQYVKGTEPIVTCTLHVKPEPPIPQCDIPWPTTHKLLIWSGLLLCDLSTKDNPEFQESDLDDYYDALAVDGVNAIRSFAFFLDEVPGYWESWKPVDVEYAKVVSDRLALLMARKITTIVSLEPYGGMATDSELSWIIDTCKPFLPFIIFEMANENGDIGLNQKLIGMLKAKGIPNSAIQIYFQDSGTYADLLQNELNGEGLSCLHGVSSMATIDQPGIGWSTSPGCLKLMSLGLYPSSDGEDATHSARGLYWFWLPPPGPGRRPSVDQIYEITKWCLQNGRGYEQLSASAFQSGGRPNLKAAIELGREERKAMRRAWEDIKCP